MTPSETFDDLGRHLDRVTASAATARADRGSEGRLRDRASVRETQPSEGPDPGP